MMTKHPRLAQLKITEISKDGFGKGERFSPEGISSSVEVPFSMPGDEVIARLLKKKTRLLSSPSCGMDSPIRG